MELTGQGVLIIDEEDICKLYFYLTHDGTTFKDSFRFEMSRIPEAFHALV